MAIQYQNGLANTNNLRAEGPRHHQKLKQTAEAKVDVMKLYDIFLIMLVVYKYTRTHFSLHVVREGRGRWRNEE